MDIILSRPEARNAVNPETAAKLYDVFLAFDRDATASVGVFTGDKGVFCAGFDLKVAGEGRRATKVGRSRLSRSRHGRHSRGPMGPTRLELTKPVIAAIEGPAVAGGMNSRSGATCG